MCRSMVDIQSVAAEIRRGKKEEDRRKKLQGKNIMAPLLHRAAITKNVTNSEPQLMTCWLINIVPFLQFQFSRRSWWRPLLLFDWEVMNLEYLIQICGPNNCWALISFFACLLNLILYLCRQYCSGSKEPYLPWCCNSCSVYIIS